MRMHIDLNRFEACPQYNDWLDRSYADESGPLNILGFQPRPSEVLFQMSQDTYQAAFADFQREWEEDLKGRALNAFPSPIAHYFYRFEAGSENDLQRLHFLRDTWESIVDVLHAVAVSECRHRRLLLTDPLKFSDLMSDKSAQRILNIERLIQAASDAGTPLRVAQIVPVATLEKMRDLNQSRNGFSHSAAQSESQARTWISECYADVLDVLDDISGLADVDIYRYLGQLNGNTLRCEVFRGHGLTRTIKAIPLTDPQVAASHRYFQQGQILVACDSDLFSLRPHVYFKEDSSGHSTKLCLFRRTRGDAPNRQIEYEVVGEAACLSEDRTSVQADIDDLRTLFGLGPE
jgi:hypothetical protein